MLDEDAHKDPLFHTAPPASLRLEVAFGADAADVAVLREGAFVAGPIYLQAALRQDFGSEVRGEALFGVELEEVFT